MEGWGILETSHSRVDFISKSFGELDFPLIPFIFYLFFSLWNTQEAFFYVYFNVVEMFLSKIKGKKKIGPPFYTNIRKERISHTPKIYVTDGFFTLYSGLSLWKES